MKLKLAGAIILFAAIIQLLPYGKPDSNPALVAEPAWDSQTTRQLFMRACADCHSNETKWPWYSRIAPVSWLVRFDVDEGREHLNVSEWGQQRKNKAHEAAQTVREGEMPPWFYLIPHPEARLTDSETTTLIQGLVATFGDKKHDRGDSEKDD